LHSFDGAVYMAPTGRPAAVQLGKHRIDSAARELAAVLNEAEFFVIPARGINCRNGFVSFAADGTPALTKHQAEHRCRHVLRGRWDKWLAQAAEDPPPGSLLDKLLTGCFLGDPDAGDKCKFVGELAGAAATGHGTRLRQPKGVIFKGEKANNGKSQLLDLLRAMLPESAVASLSASRFSDDRFVVHLAGKLLNAPDELSSAAVIASDVFKRVITGEPCTGRDVYKSAVQFNPVALHVFATNVLPLFTGGFDRGVQRRLLVLQFDRVIPDHEQIEGLGRRVAYEEADLLVAFAVAGARRLLLNGRYTEPASSRRALALWLYSGDPVLAWVRARLRPREDGEYLPAHSDQGIKSADAYSDFRGWAKAAGYRENLLPAVNGFIMRVTANAAFARIRHTNIGNRLLGCVMTDPPEEDDDDEIRAADRGSMS
jgi:phage/plasmid-associated DNA primase